MRVSPSPSVGPAFQRTRSALLILLKVRERHNPVDGPAVCLGLERILVQGPIALALSGQTF